MTAPHREASIPVHRMILAVDIEGSTNRTNPVKEELREQLYRLVRGALVTAGIDSTGHDPFTDRGDGVLVLLRPSDNLPKPLLLSRLIPALASLLAAYNSGISPPGVDQFFKDLLEASSLGTPPARRIRGSTNADVVEDVKRRRLERNPLQSPPIEPVPLQPRILRVRAAIHAGEVHYDGRGSYGEDLDVAFRLLDAPELKKRLRSTGAPLALVASDYIYQAIIRHGHDGIDAEEFLPFVTVNVGGTRRKGWVHLPRPVEVPARAAKQLSLPEVDQAFEHRLAVVC
jgi:class 3 adenylate cyclase